MKMLDIYCHQCGEPILAHADPAVAAACLASVDEDGAPTA
jgi:hypothetical protein